MIATIQCEGQQFRVDFSAGRSLAIPLDPRQEHPSFFAAEQARARPLAAGDYVGDVAQGGSCNADVLQLIPHCHGTHTECIGHLTTERQRVQETIYSSPCAVLLLSLEGEHQADSDHPRYTTKALEQALKPWTGTTFEALALRQHPSPGDLARRDYADQPSYPILALDAMNMLASMPLKHLLVDSPSLDPAHDGGKLERHRCWWGLDGTTADKDLDPAMRSVTEMILAPDDLQDGLYWMQLELSPVVGDATPSRPMLYPMASHHD